MSLCSCACFSMSCRSTSERDAKHPATNSFSADPLFVCDSSFFFRSVPRAFMSLRLVAMRYAAMFKPDILTHEKTMCAFKSIPHLSAILLKSRGVRKHHSVFINIRYRLVRAGNVRSNARRTEALNRGSSVGFELYLISRSKCVSSRGVTWIVSF